MSTRATRRQALRLVSAAALGLAISQRARAQAGAAGAAAAANPAMRQVAASLHMLLLMADGRVLAAGENRAGQLGRPARSGAQPPGWVALPQPARQVAAGGDTSYAVLEDGRVWAWGRGAYRQLGVAVAERDTPEPVPGLEDVVAVAAAENSALALRADGRVLAWGELPPLLSGGQAVNPGVARALPVAGLQDIVRLSWNGGFGLALARDGRVFAFGQNRGGALGIAPAAAGDTALPPTAVPGLADVVAVATEAGACVAVTADGRVWTWGRNHQAGLGNGRHADVGDAPQTTPQPVAGVSGAVDVAAGGYGRHILVRTRSGGLVGWGSTDWGQLGAGLAGQHQPSPRPVKLAAVQAHWAGGNFAFASTRDGGFWFWGEASGARALLGQRSQHAVPVRVPAERLQPA